MEKPQLFVGVDVSKDTLDVAVLGNEGFLADEKILNQPTVIRKFIRELLKTHQIDAEQVIFCLEHTGIYGYPLLGVLAKKGIKACVEPGLQIKQSQGMTRGKNDQVDARRIALYAYAHRENLRFWSPPRLVVQKLQAMLTVRERLIKVRTQLQVPLREAAMFMNPSIGRSIQRTSQKTLRGLESDIKAIEKQIHQLVNQG
jgi:transposase